MRSIVIGLGETGSPLYEVLKEAYPETKCYDKKQGDYIPVMEDCYVMNICIPYMEGFADVVKGYQDILKPEITVIHSTVPIGTTAKIPNAVHSPIRGRHNRMKSDLKRYVKWIGGDRAGDVADYFKGAGFSIRVVPTSEQTEAMKLLCLAKYGVSLAFARYCHDVAGKYNFEFGYHDIYSWDAEYNEHVGYELQRPLITVVDKKIGGHCVVQNMPHLKASDPNPMLDEVLKYE